jgi:hypothetical protein
LCDQRIGHRGKWLEQSIAIADKRLPRQQLMGIINESGSNDPLCA